MLTGDRCALRSAGGVPPEKSPSEQRGPGTLPIAFGTCSPFSLSLTVSPAPAPSPLTSILPRLQASTRKSLSQPLLHFRVGSVRLYRRAHPLAQRHRILPMPVPPTYLTHIEENLAAGGEHRGRVHGGPQIQALFQNCTTEVQTNRRRAGRAAAQSHARLRGDLHVALGPRLCDGRYRRSGDDLWAGGRAALRVRALPQSHVPASLRGAAAHRLSAPSPHLGPRPAPGPLCARTRPRRPAPHERDPRRNGAPPTASTPFGTTRTSWPPCAVRRNT